MDRKTQKQAAGTLDRFKCGSSAVCIREAGREPRIRAGNECPASETEDILFALAKAVEQRDRHTGSHCERLALIAVTLGIAMRLERAGLVALYRGAYLHDVGKVGIPDSILFKPGGLTPDEWTVMRSHTVRGEEICRHLQSLQPVLPIVRHHHERWDGSGYPDGLRGEQIPLMARVLQIADIYDALTNPRPYKPVFSPAEAQRIIQEETARGWRDPEIVKIFIRVRKNMISKLAGFNEKAGSSLANLQHFLAAS
jgi:putative two-component system response regulator